MSHHAGKVVVLAVALLAGAGFLRPSGRPEGTWRVVSVERDGSQVRLRDEPITVEITTTTVEGTLACNNWRAARGSDGDFASSLTGTDVGCSTVGAEDQLAVQEAVSDATAYDVDGGTLTLTGPGVRMVLVGA